MADVPTGEAIGHAVALRWVAEPGRVTAARLAEALPPHEQLRAAGLADEATRTRFVAGRILLRRAIGTALGHDDWRLVTEPGGALRVEAPEPLYVNLTHTDGLVAAALSRAGPVGIDAEALGLGLAVPFDGLVFRLDPLAALVLPGGAGAWHVALCRPTSRHQIAVARRDRDARGRPEHAGPGASPLAHGLHDFRGRA